MDFSGAAQTALPVMEPAKLVQELALKAALLARQTSISMKRLVVEIAPNRGSMSAGQTAQAATQTA